MAHRVDATEVCQIFPTWAQQTWVLEPEAVLSIDGKALASTGRDCHGQKQDFVSVVSACVQQCDGVLAQVSFQNGQSSEIASVRQLLDQLDVQGAWVRLDALLAKKRLRRLWAVGMTTALVSSAINPNSCTKPSSVLRRRQPSVTISVATARTGALLSGECACLLHPQP